jgi:hypothetical protein
MGSKRISMHAYWSQRASSSDSSAALARKRSGSPTEVADFLDSLDDEQLRKLKQLAESLLQEPVYTGHA